MEWFDDLRQWADAHSGLISLVALIIVPLAGFFAMTRARMGQITIADQIADKASWPDLIRDFRQGRSESYFAALDRLLAFATRVYGPKPLSPHAFNRCLTIALIYPIIAMLIGWVVANQHSPGGLVVFADDPIWWSRLGKALILAGALTLSGWIFAKIEAFGGWAVENLFPSLDDNVDRIGFLPKAIRSVTEWVAVVAAVAVAFAAAGAVAFALFGVITPADAGIFLFFFAALPVVNALADILSLAATRWFLSNVTSVKAAEGIAAKHASLGRIMSQLALDLCVAALCLGLLLGLTTAGLDLWASVSSASIPLDWRAYWADVQADWSNGWALYLMIATTLLPTALHAAAGLGAVLTHKSRLSKRVATRLEAATAANEDLSKREQANLVTLVHRATLWGYGAGGLLALCGLGITMALIVAGLGGLATAPIP